MDAKTIVHQARAAAPHLPPEPVLQALVYVPTNNTAGEMYDPHEAIREAVALLLYPHVQPDDRAFIRYLLTQEIAQHAAEQEGMLPNIKRCAAMLYRLGMVEDSLLIWEAKDTHFDTLCGLDVQLLIGGGLDATVAYLHTVDATDAIAYIEACRERGDFADMERFERELEQYFRDVAL
jgi:hypothetical protein